MHKIPAWVTDRIPDIQKASYLPQRFTDSTHELWQLQLARQLKTTRQLKTARQLKKAHPEFATQCAFLKVCTNTKSPFWQIMQQLFGLDLKKEIPAFSNLYQHIGSLTSLKIPELIQAASFRKKEMKEEDAYILTSELSGSAVEDVSPLMATQLAEYLAEMHQDKSQNWGLMTKPVYSKEQWPQRLKQVLIDFSKQQNVAGDIYLSAIKSCEKIACEEFVPVMPDLRWDQFLQQDQKLTALVDLDAFVFAPRELDFVLLEFILEKEQFAAFLKVYSQAHTIPDITEVRPAYRLLLFLMQVQGELDIEACF